MAWWPLYNFSTSEYVWVKRLKVKIHFRATRKFRIRRPLLEYTQRSICKVRNICFEFTQMQGSIWLSGIHFIAKDFFVFLSKSQDFQSKHKGKDWRLVSNLRLRISSLSLRAPWTYKKLWTLQCIFLACLKTLSFAVTICYIYMLKCSYMSIFSKSCL